MHNGSHSKSKPKKIIKHLFLSWFGIFFLTVKLQTNIFSSFQKETFFCSWMNYKNEYFINRFTIFKEKEEILKQNLRKKMKTHNVDLESIDRISLIDKTNITSITTKCFILKELQMSVWCVCVCSCECEFGENWLINIR